MTVHSSSDSGVIAGQRHDELMITPPRSRQPRRRTDVDKVIDYELLTARGCMKILADRELSHIVSTSLARDILQQFIHNGIVQVFGGVASRSNDGHEQVLDPNSGDVRCVIQQAFEDADQYERVWPDADDGPEELEPHDKDVRGEGTTCSFKWKKFWGTQMSEGELVSFLHMATDQAFVFAKSKLSEVHPNLVPHLVLAEDQNRAEPSYGFAGEVLRRDFCMPPIHSEKLKYDLAIDDHKYMPTPSQRNDISLAKMEQIPRHAQGFKLADPWVEYVVELKISMNQIMLMSRECLSTERLQLILAHGRGCIEFIRILLGLALADVVYLDTVPFPQPVVPKSSLKRVHSEDGHEEVRTKKQKVGVHRLGSIEFYPGHTYGDDCLGILFQSNWIYGGTTVLLIRAHYTWEKKRLVLKMSWQDAESEVNQNAVMKRLKEHEPHPNVVRIFDPERDGNTSVTLDVVREFIDEDMNYMTAENRVLSVTMSDLKRPVRYFWDIHDFVQGLRGALLGHEFLTKIGILHRDISENNIVLGIYPWDERGYLIDFDKAILQDPEKLTRNESGDETSISADTVAEGTYMKGLRVGTFPYMSFNVLMGGRHTYFDDVESFLYVLFLFFFSYAGPLSKDELEYAYVNGFVRPARPKRLLSHVRSWPEKYARWCGGDPEMIGHLKAGYIWTHGSALVKGPEFEECLKHHWPETLHSAIRSLLIKSFDLFGTNARHTPERTGTQVSHGQFIQVLDEWLASNSALEDEHSNCPHL